MQSRLAVILHADVVGSTALVQRNELLAHQRIQAAFKRFAELVRLYGGSVTEMRGDAFLAEFARASDAVLAALAAQQSNAQANELFDDGVRPVLRVGIALGEVVYADDTVTGAGVVLAQRLEQLASPGGLCVSAAVREAVPTRLPFDYKDLGFRDPKGFDHPVQSFAITPREGHALPAPAPAFTDRSPVWRRPRHWLYVIGALLAIVFALWLQPWSSDSDTADQNRMAYPLPDRPSIAVLPFENLSADADQEFLSDGLTENITLALSRVPELFVIPRATTRIYKQNPATVAQVSEQLGIRYVLDGSVQRSADKVRITTQLIDALSGDHMWTELYDRDVADFFAVQDEIALSVLTELKVQLMTGESGLRVGTRNLGAYQLLHEGRRKMGRLSKAGIAEARGLYLQAVEIDPLYVGAWVTLGWSHLISANRGWSEDPQQDTELALKFAQKGRAINASASSPYSLLAAISVRERRYDEAISYSEQAVALAPNDASAIALLARSLTFAGRAEEALAPIETVKRYTPIPPPLLLRWEGVVYHTLGRYEEAVVVLERADAANPNVFSRAWLALTHADMGHMQAAREAAASVLELSPVFSAKGFANAVMAYKDETRHKRNLAILLEVGLPE